MSMKKNTCWHCHTERIANFAGLCTTCSKDIPENLLLKAEVAFSLREHAINGSHAWWVHNTTFGEVMNQITTLVGTNDSIRAACASYEKARKAGAA